MGETQLFDRGLAQCRKSSAIVKRTCVDDAQDRLSIIPVPWWDAVQHVWNSWCPR
jgi:hypothetical protein